MEAEEVDERVVSGLYLISQSVRVVLLWVLKYYEGIVLSSRLFSSWNVFSWSSIRMTTKSILKRLSSSAADSSRIYLQSNTYLIVVLLSEVLLLLVLLMYFNMSDIYFWILPPLRLISFSPLCILAYLVEVPSCCALTLAISSLLCSIKGILHNTCELCQFVCLCLYTY